MKKECGERIECHKGVEYIRIKRRKVKYKNIQKETHYVLEQKPDTR